MIFLTHEAVHNRPYQASRLRSAFIVPIARGPRSVSRCFSSSASRVPSTPLRSPARTLAVWTHRHAASIKMRSTKPGARAAAEEEEEEAGAVVVVGGGGGEAARS